MSVPVVVDNGGGMVDIDMLGITSPTSISVKMEDVAFGSGFSVIVTNSFSASGNSKSGTARADETMTKVAIKNLNPKSLEKVALRFKCVQLTKRMA